MSGGHSESKVFARDRPERTIAWHTARLPDEQGQGRWHPEFGY